MGAEIWVILSAVAGMWGALVYLAVSNLRSGEESGRLAVPMWSTLVEGRRGGDR
ncbi:MAG: hypothetical protein H0V53_06420 [Rubrobacter sp.]|jgi:hypothetical protein|nr:hypothetical protein [Rubrobacter sp.]